MSFEWLDSKRPPGQAGRGADRGAKAAADEVAHRAGLFYRLGYSLEAATKRLTARVAWEHPRHASLNDQSVAKIVADTYARKPG